MVAVLSNRSAPPALKAIARREREVKVLPPEVLMEIVPSGPRLPYTTAEWAELKAKRVIAASDASLFFMRGGTVRIAGCFCECLAIG
jgi:hypothetical protein